MARIKVVHVPARTPYARKLNSRHVEILNERTLDGVGMVPRDLTLRGVLARQPFTWFDVLHLHHIEFDDPATLRLVLSECARMRRHVVFTAHDVEPVFGDRVSYHRKLRTLVEWQVPFVCLTPGSAREVRRRFGPAAVTTTVPHGYVVPPEAAPPHMGRTSDSVRYLIFGALRDNRDVATVLYNWRFGRRQQQTILSLLLRAPGRINLEQEGGRWALISSMAAHEPRLRVEVAPFPTDDEIAQAAAGCDALILPYRWGSHSGQLELALDLGLLPVASSVGYLREQYQLHAGLVAEPVWFDWADGTDYAYGERFLAALDRATEFLERGAINGRRAGFAEHRRAEHIEILTAYHDLYERAWT